MKRTISEVIELIKQKKEGLEYMLSMADEELNGEFVLGSIRGQIMILKDILTLLETSHLLEQEKAIEIFKKYFYVDIIGWSAGSEETYYGIREKNNVNTHRISEEEYDLLNEVLKND